jgi:hypothetical protein
LNIEAEDTTATIAGARDDIKAHVTTEINNAEEAIKSVDEKVGAAEGAIKAHVTAEVDDAETAIKDHVTAEVDDAEGAIKAHVTTEVDGAETAIKDHVTVEVDDAETNIKKRVDDAETAIKGHVTAEVDDAETAIKDHVTAEVDDAETNIKKRVDDAEGAIKAHVTTSVASVKTDTVKILAVDDTGGIKHDTIEILSMLQEILTRVYHYTLHPLTLEQADRVACLRVIAVVEEQVLDRNGNLEPIRSDERTLHCLSLLEGKPIEAWFRVVLSDFEADDVPALLERYQQIQELRQALILHFTLPSLTQEQSDKVRDCLRVIIDIEERVVDRAFDLDQLNADLQEIEDLDKTKRCLALLRSDEGEPILAQKFQDMFSKFQTVDMPVRLMRYQQIQELRQALIQHFTATVRTNVQP